MADMDDQFITRPGGVQEATCVGDRLVDAGERKLALGLIFLLQINDDERALGHEIIPLCLTFYNPGPAPRSVAGSS
ncbi:hypothetical protein D3C81_1840580 [compost metagenome]